MTFKHVWEKNDTHTYYDSMNNNIPGKTNQNGNKTIQKHINMVDSLRDHNHRKKNFIS